MLLRSDIRSPNFSDVSIVVEFVVIHYTAVDINETLNIFTTPSSKASAHLVIDRDGSVFELVDCFNGSPKMAWHAGKSSLKLNDTPFTDFNTHSIGIELVNLNGNVFPFTDAQYSSLIDVIQRLKRLFPNLNSPDRVVGHEQIAGFRGKCDPGSLFDWRRVLNACFPNMPSTDRTPRCPMEIAQRLKVVLNALGIVADERGEIVAPSDVNQRVLAALSSLVESILVDRDWQG